MPIPTLFRPLVILTKKHPSPDVNPATHSGWAIFCVSTLGRGTGIVSGKAAFKTSDNPKLSEARIFTISWSPFNSRCSPRSIIRTTSLNRR
ncbi:hypothetical protein HOY80DRAFT_897639 [Tuber brumale]|nr:hypothetical protein HOY80DRAFT_897639 [Tuber brumale]